jgi:hypothetical protein
MPLSKIYTNKLLFLLMVFLLLTIPAFAQGPGDGGPTPTEPPVTDIPIDGGVSLLIAGGAALGLGKLRKKLKK